MLLYVDSVVISNWAMHHDNVLQVIAYCFEKFTILTS